MCAIEHYMEQRRAAGRDRWGFALQALSAIVLAFVIVAMIVAVAGCKLNVTQSQTVIVRILPAETPAPGCGAIALGATPAGPAGVVLSLAPAGSYTLLDGGVSLGPAADGQLVTLASGTHELQAVAGACASNRVLVEVP